MKDQIIQGILMHGFVRFIAITGKEMVAEAQKTHNTSRVCTAALGRQLLATAMMSARLKNSTDKLTTMIKGNGPAGNIVCTGYPYGIVKGYITNPTVELPLTQAHKLDVSGAVGKRGKLTVIRDLSLKEPYIGECNLISGEIAEDFAQYFTVSEQDPSLVYLGVRVEPRTVQVMAAGGLIVQPMPGCPDDIIDMVQNRVSAISALTERLENGQSLQEILEDIFNGMEPEWLKNMEPAFRCDCSRERIERILLALGKQELESMLQEDGQAELTCQFCNTAYQFSAKDLEMLIQEAMQ